MKWRLWIANIITPLAVRRINISWHIVTLLNLPLPIDCTTRKAMEMVLPDSCKHTRTVNGNLPVIMETMDNISRMLPKFSVNNWGIHMHLLKVKEEKKDLTPVDSGSTNSNAMAMKTTLSSANTLTKQAPVKEINISNSIVTVSHLQLSTDCSKRKTIMMMGIPESFKVSKMENGNLLVMVVEFQELLIPNITIPLLKFSADNWMHRILERTIHMHMLELNM
jgi:hypothetical protein